MPVWRRAQPHLGTLVEIGVSGDDLCEGMAHHAMDAAFEAVATVHRLMSRFDPQSDVGKFHQAAVGQPVLIHPQTHRLLQWAKQLYDLTDGLFDVSLGTGTWSVEASGPHWIKHDAGTRVDLGGIAKGYAVDHAIEALLDAGLANAWVNAGGDLRAVGSPVPIDLRDEDSGGVQRWAQLQDAALATSCFSKGARSALHGELVVQHVSVVAPECVAADALTKVVAQVGMEKAGPWLRFFNAQAWVHA